MTLSNTLRNVVDMDEDSAQYLREETLDDITLPEEWTVDNREEFPVVDVTDNWTLAALTNTDGTTVFIELLGGSHFLQLFNPDTGEILVEPTYDETEIETALKTTA